MGQDSFLKVLQSLIILISHMSKMFTKKHESPLRSSMRQMTTVGAYESAIQLMFEDQCFMISKGYVLWIFTSTLMQMQPHIASQIATVYNRFVFEHFHSIDIYSLSL
jgi:hypothetical protein